MQRYRGASLALLSLLAGVAMGRPTNPSDAGGRGAQSSCPGNPGPPPKCSAAPTSKCVTDKTIIVYQDGLHGGDSETFVCNGGQVDWQVDGSVADITIHFDQSPFHPQFCSADYCAEAHCDSKPNDTGKLTTHAYSSAANDIRCHKYTVTVVPTHGARLVIDPHIIVAQTGTTN